MNTQEVIVILTARRDAIEAALKAISSEMQQYPRGQMGLVLSSAKDETWVALKAEYDLQFKALQTTNKLLVASRKRVKNN